MGSPRRCSGIDGHREGMLGLENWSEVRSTAAAASIFVDEKRGATHKLRLWGPHLHRQLISRSE